MNDSFGLGPERRYVVRNIKTIIAFVTSICLMVAVAGCSGDEALSPETDLPAAEPVGTVENEVPPVEPDKPDGPSDPNEFIGFSEEYLNKEYGSFTEAYLDILVENRLVLTDGNISDYQKFSGLLVGEGKIVIINVFGDETPELLCLYYTDPESGLYLKIFSYSKTGRVESSFDNVIYQAIGGEHDYCVYITRDGELMMYRRTSGTASVGGFWPIIPDQDMKNEEDFFQYDRSLAVLCYLDNGELYIQYGEEISKDRFDKVSNEIMQNIDTVLFQGSVRNGLGPWLYEYELWRDITPFEEESMTFAEAVAWLEAQIENQ